MKTLILTLALGLFSGTPAFASDSISADQSSEWQREDHLFDAFRSNAPHFWNWLKSQHSLVLNPSGVVVGDPHILNFSDVQLATQGREFALIDLDDGGANAPLAGDLIRYAAGNQVSPYQISLNKIFDAYVQGLKGLQMSEPQVLSDALSYSDADYLERQSQYMDKMTKQNRFSAKADVKPLSHAPASVQELFNQARGYFEASMPGYQILDTGYKIKKSGGSSGLPRYWYLIQRNQTRYIMEFKLEVDAATSFYSYQGTPVERFPPVAEIYRPAGTVYGPYKIVATPAGQFLMRARLKPYLDFEDEGNIEDGRQMSLYIANRLGLWHGQQTQSGDLLKVLRYPEFEQLVITYVRLMKKENY
ncbi:hypothetical protein ACLVWU_04180 [Bdellovibrio sp. HCB290]|uniref:hypothetical protein n=1 Tax=Bdellovibrio sp. HCB290 TaxID=3394356 RepID=UPI0039B4E2B5